MVIGSSTQDWALRAAVSLLELRELYAVLKCLFLLNVALGHILEAGHIAETKGLIVLVSFFLSVSVVALWLCTWRQ